MRSPDALPYVAKMHRDKADPDAVPLIVARFRNKAAANHFMRTYGKDLLTIEDSRIVARTAIGQALNRPTTATQRFLDESRLQQKGD